MIKIKYPAKARKQTGNEKIVNLQVSSVAAIYRLRFLGSVFLFLRKDLNEKSGRLRDFCVPVGPLYFFSFFFFNRPGRTVMCSICIYTSQYLIESFTVRCLFSLSTDFGKQTITLFATNNYNSILTYTNCVVRVQVQCSTFMLRNV